MCFSPAGELFDLFCRFRAHIVSGVLFLLWRLYSYRCLWQLGSRPWVTGEGDRDGDRAIKQERAALAQNMAGSICANVCACVGLYSMCGCADMGGNDEAQDQIITKSFTQFSLQCFCLPHPCTCSHKHTHHTLGTWRSLNNERQVCNLSFTVAVEQGRRQGEEDGSIHHRDKVWLLNRISTPLPPSVIVRMTHRQVSHNQWDKSSSIKKLKKKTQKPTRSDCSRRAFLHVWAESQHPIARPLLALDLPSLDKQHKMF